jgi:hydroxyethylthiazole kinase
MMTPESVWNDVARIRAQAPLVHNITNYVVMNTTANALLALGASPVMAHAVNELEEMVGIASSLVINIGTLDPAWVLSMETAMHAARARPIPVVLDPVGVGATSLRTKAAHRLLETGAVTILRGNGSEIMALSSAEAKTKGVDSLRAAEDAVGAATALSGQHGCAVAVSGEVDVVVGDGHAERIANGHPMMPQVTGLGCTASALCGAFAAVNPSPVQAAAHAMAVMGICGELAAETAPGPGTLQVRFIDALYTLTEDDVSRRLR